MNMNSTKREVLLLNPTNIGAFQKFSPDRSGLQQVVFQLPQIPRLMKGRSLRINGTFEVKNANDAFPQNATYWNSDNPTTNSFYIDGRIGVSSCIDTLTIQNLQGGTYSNIKNYNRLCASIVPLNQSFNNYINGVDYELAPGKQVSMAKKCDKPFDFSLPLLDGYLQGNDFIDMQLQGGMILTLTLAPSNFVINNNYWYNQTADTPNGAYYEWSNLTLSVETEIVSPEQERSMLQNTKGVMSYSTFSSFYNVVLSNQHNLSFLFNTRDTSAVVGNLIPSSWLNNYQFNSSSTPQLLYEKAAGVLNNNIRMNGFTYQKSGARFPYDLVIESKETQDEGVADSLKNLTEIDAVRDGWSLYNMLKSIKTELSNPLSNTEPNKFDRERYSIVEEDQEQQYNIGVSFDKLGSGVDFRGQTFNLRVQSNLPAAQSFQPHSMFLFVRHQNTIIFEDGKIQVLS